MRENVTENICCLDGVYGFCSKVETKIQANPYFDFKKSANFEIEWVMKRVYQKVWR